MITISLDNIDREVFEKEQRVFLDLAEFRQNNIIKMHRDFFSKIETDRLKDENGKDIRDWIEENVLTTDYNCSVRLNSTDKEKESEKWKQMSYTKHEFDTSFLRLRKILGKKTENKKKILNNHVDLRILLQHILEKRDFFVTCDKKFIKFVNDRRENLKDFPEIKIREFNQKFIREIELLSGCEIE
ncbi:hypothetical protein HYV86_06060 [Candidatus Woesearchaeota archaeon]|nr:hypothetical protein [Candidatus Woesearchaeota archaeon]